MGKRGPKYSDALLLDAILRSGGSQKRAAQIAGCNYMTLRYRVQKSEELQTALKRAVEDSAKVKAGLGAERVAFKEQLSNLNARIDDATLASLILKHYGDLLAVAKECEMHPVTLQRLVDMTPVLKQAMVDSEAYFGMDAERRYRAAIMGQEEVSAKEMQALKHYMACKRNWTPKTRVEHSGAVYDLNTLPAEIGEVEKPMLKRVK